MSCLNLNLCLFSFIGESRQYSKSSLACFQRLEIFLRISYIKVADLGICWLMMLFKEIKSTADKISSMFSNSSSLVNVQFLRIISLNLLFWVSRQVPSGLLTRNGTQYNGKHKAFEKFAAYLILKLIEFKDPRVFLLIYATFGKCFIFIFMYWSMKLHFEIFKFLAF